MSEKLYNKKIHDQNDKLTIGLISDYFFTDIGIYPKKTITNFITNLKEMKDDIKIEEIKNDIEFAINILSTHSNPNSFYDNFTYNMTDAYLHATFQIVHKKGDKNYHHYYFNSGSGTEYTVNGNTKHQFRTSSSGFVNPILEFVNDKYVELSDKSYNMTKVYEDDLKNYTSKDNFFFMEMQLQGNCAMRSIIYPIYVVLKLKFKKTDSYLNYLLDLIRLYILNKNIRALFPNKLN